MKLKMTLSLLKVSFSYGPNFIKLIKSIFYDKSIFRLVFFYFTGLILRFSTVTWVFMPVTPTAPFKKGR